MAIELSYKKQQPCNSKGVFTNYTRFLIGTGENQKQKQF